LFIGYESLILKFSSSEILDKQKTKQNKKQEGLNVTSLNVTTLILLANRQMQNLPHIEVIPIA
jgi:hypothetical protein